MEHFHQYHAAVSESSYDAHSNSLLSLLIDCLFQMLQFQNHLVMDAATHYCHCWLIDCFRCCSFRIIVWFTQQLTIVTVDWLIVSDAAVSESSCDSHSNSPLSLLIDWLFQMLQSQNHLVMHTSTHHCHCWLIDCFRCCSLRIILWCTQQLSIVTVELIDWLFVCFRCCSLRIILRCTQQLTISTVDWLIVSDGAVSESSWDAHSNSLLPLLIDWLFQMVQSQNHLVMHTSTHQSSLPLLIDWLFQMVQSQNHLVMHTSTHHCHCWIDWLIVCLFQMLQSQNHLVMHTATQHCHRCAFFNTEWDTFDDFFTRTSSCIRPQLY